MKEADKDAAAAGDEFAWLKEFGVTTTNIADVASVPGSNDAVVGIVRGQIPVSKIQNYAKRKGLKSVTVGDRIFFEVSIDSEKQTQGEKPSVSTKPISILIHAYDSKTLVFSDKANAPKVLAALSGKAASYVPPAYLLAYGKTLNTPPIILGYAGPKFLKEKPRASKDPNAMQMVLGFIPDQLFFAAGDSGRNAGFRLAAGYPTAKKAQESVTQIQGLLGFFAMMFTAPEAEDGAPLDAKQIEDAKQLSAALSRLKISAKDTYLMASFTYPTADAVKAVQAAIAMANEPKPAPKSSTPKKRP